MKKMMSCQNPNLGLLLIRLGLAAVFIAHGISKLSNMDQTIGFFASLGLAAFFAYLVAIVELLGGIAMLLGLWTKWAGYALAIIMLVAIILVKSKMPFAKGAYEIDLMLLVAALGIAMIGSGKYSIGGGCEMSCPCDSNGNCAKGVCKTKK